MTRAARQVPPSAEVPASELALDALARALAPRVAEILRGAAPENEIAQVLRRGRLRDRSDGCAGREGQALAGCTVSAGKYATSPADRAAAARRDELAKTEERDAEILAESKLVPKTVQTIAALARALERELGCTQHSALLGACTFLSR